jgi:aldose 1-epimerase
MFSAVQKFENGFDKIVLTDEKSGTVAEIIPACGAILNCFAIRQPAGMLNIIDSYQSAKEFNRNVVTERFKGCKLSPYACRINNARYNFAGKEYHIDGYSEKGHALHGLLFDAIFKVIEIFADQEKALVSMLHQYKGTDKGYPFYYDCLITYSLHHKNSINITTEIINKDKGLIPLQDGWHPYFTFGNRIDELQIEFQSKEVLELNDSLIPTGGLKQFEAFGSLRKINDRAFDNCFTLNFHECQPLCVLRDTERKLQVEIYPDTSYPYLNIYTPPDRKSIAIENLSAAPDAFNNRMGLITLQPGLSAVFNTKYKINTLN